MFLLWSLANLAAQTTAPVSPSPGGSPSSSPGSGFQFSHHDTAVALILLFLLALALVGIVMLFVWQSWGGRSLLATPFMTWFLLHFIIAGLGLTAVVTLALANVLDSAGTSALLGSLLGYVLGTVSAHANTSSRTDSVSPRLTGIFPTEGQANTATAIAITGEGFLDIKGTPKVLFDDHPAGNAKVANANMIVATTPQLLNAGVVTVTVSLVDGTQLPGKVTFKINQVG